MGLPLVQPATKSTISGSESAIGREIFCWHIGIIDEKCQATSVRSSEVIALFHKIPSLRLYNNTVRKYLAL